MHAMAFMRPFLLLSLVGSRNAGLMYSWGQPALLNDEKSKDILVSAKALKLVWERTLKGQPLNCQAAPVTNTATTRCQSREPRSGARSVS